jgi:hypothetical protein
MKKKTDKKKLAVKRESLRKLATLDDAQLEKVDGAALAFRTYTCLTLPPRG